MDSDMETKNPLIKRLLKSYKAVSENSLSGPCQREENFSKVILIKPIYDRREAEVNKEFENKCPIFITMDTSFSELTSTELEGEIIACFEIGGEKRLCLAQIIKSILSGYTLPQIHSVFEVFHIFSAVCTPTQLNCLKEKEIIPLSASKCGLVTKSDAQRFCSVLLRSKTLSNESAVTSSSLPFNRRRVGFVNERGDIKKSSCFGVFHKCFGGCQGIFVQNLFRSSHSACIQCEVCSSLLSPQEFVSHIHSVAEHKQTCHWGFDSANWRKYLRLDPRELLEHEESLRKIKEEIEVEEDIFQRPDLKDRRVNTDGSCARVVFTESPSDNICRSPKVLKHSVNLTVDRYKKEPPALLHPSDGKNRFSTNNFAPNVSLLPDHNTTGDHHHHHHFKYPMKKSRMDEYDDDDDDDDAAAATADVYDYVDDADGDDDVRYGGARDKDVKFERGRGSRVCLSMSDEDLTTIQQLDEIQEVEMKLFRMALNSEELNQSEKDKILSQFCNVQKKFQLLLNGLVDKNNLLNQQYQTINAQLPSKSLSQSHQIGRGSTAATHHQYHRLQNTSTDYYHHSSHLNHKKQKLHSSQRRTISPVVSRSAPTSNYIFEATSPCDSDDDSSGCLDQSQQSHVDQPASPCPPVKRKRCHTYTSSDQPLVKMES